MLQVVFPSMNSNARVNILKQVKCVLFEFFSEICNGIFYRPAPVITPIQVNVSLNFMKLCTTAEQSLQNSLKLRVILFWNMSSFSGGGYRTNLLLSEIITFFKERNYLYRISSNKRPRSLFNFEALRYGAWKKTIISK